MNVNAVGRLSHTSDQVSVASNFAYDVMGRLTLKKDCVPSDCNYDAPQSASYNYAGSMNSFTYPDGRQISLNYDGAGRLSAVADASGTQYASKVSYLPNGSPNQTTFGNGLVETRSLNSRLQICESALGVTGGESYLDRQYFYGSNTTSGTQCSQAAANNNGNLLHVMDGLSGGTNSQHYSYDALNRLATWQGNNALGTFRQQSFGYDSFGNMLSSWSGTAPTVGPQQFNSGNRVVYDGGSNCTSDGAPGYDAAGNMTCAGTLGSDEYDNGFNSLGQLVAFQHKQNNSPPQWTYRYDAAGERVRADQTVNGSVNSWREYTYFGGMLVAQKDQSGTWTDHIYANGRRIAQVTSTRSPVHEHIEHATTGCFVTFSQGGLASNSYTVQQGDKIYTDYMATGAYWGFALFTADSPQQPATYLMLPDTAGASKQYQPADISFLKGRTLTAWAPAAYTQATVADGNLFHLSIVSSNGVVTPLFTGQPFAAPVVSDACAYTNASDATQMINTPEVRYFTGDQVGTVQMEFSDLGSPLWQGEFSPFGQELDTEYTVNRYKFTGKERDSESGFDYFEARYYGSGMGRFLSPDPSLLAYADPGNPQSLNLYSYVLNRPLTFVDPLGLAPTGSCGSPDRNSSGSAAAWNCDASRNKDKDPCDDPHNGGCVNVRPDYQPAALSAIRISTFNFYLRPSAIPQIRFRYSAPNNAPTVSHCLAQAGSNGRGIALGADIVGDIATAGGDCQPGFDRRDSCRRSGN